MSSVIATSWCKNLVGMGTLNKNNMPTQYDYDGIDFVSGDGYQCFGFATFAHWYIFAQKNTDKVTATLVKTGSLTYDTLKYARPGDVIRFYTSWTDGHSAIFVSCDSSGFTVLDCNYKDNATGQYACEIKLHKLSYESSGRVAITGVKNYDRALTYIEECTEYPSYLTLKITSATTLKKYPCSKSTDASSTDIYTPAIGETFTSYALWENTEGNFWYEVQYNGTTCYLYAGNAEVVKTLYSDIKVSSLSAPTNHTKGESFWLSGTVKSTYNRLGTVYAYAYYGDANYGTDNIAISNSDAVHANSYSLKNSDLDAGLMFSSLAVGDYNFVIKVNATNYSSNGTSKTEIGETIIIKEQAFTVSKANATTYKVSFNANGGSCSTSSKTVTYAGTYGTLPTPTRTGYTFAGWYTASSGGTRITSDSIVGITEDQTLYAHWTAKTYTVSFDANGGTGAPAAQTKTHGTALTLSSTVPVRDGYTFLGWASSSAAAAAEYSAGSSYTAEGTATLYAVWEKNPAIVTFDPNGGELESAGSMEVQNDGTLAGLPNARRDDYTFLGWFSLPEGGIRVDTKTIFSRDTTVYAQWQEDTINGDVPQMVVSDATGRPGSEVTLTVSVKNNPGIAAFDMNIVYDPSRLKPVDYVFAGAFEGSLSTVSTATGKAGFVSLNDVTGDGAVLNLTFEILDTAPDGAAIVSVEIGEIINVEEEPIEFAAVAGQVTVVSRVPGDVTGDGKVGTVDVLRLLKYVNGQDVSIVEGSGDVTGDGKVGTADVLRLLKFVNGQDVEIN